jgi:hypothetical protein
MRMWVGGSLMLTLCPFASVAAMLAFLFHVMLPIVVHIMLASYQLFYMFLLTAHDSNRCDPINL